MPAANRPRRAEIARLPKERWREYRELRLEALKTDPEAFGSSYEEEAGLPDERWKERMDSAIFAVSGGRLVGTLSCVFNDRAKTRHTAHIYGVYVAPGRRGEGVGRALLKAALSEIRRRGGMVKVQLNVNPEMRAAVALYEGAGFEVSGRARKELKVGRRYCDMLLMEKMLRRTK